MLKVASDSKNSAIKPTEAAENHVKQFEEARDCNSYGTYDSQKQILETYISVIAEHYPAKKELWRIRHDYGASEEAKDAAVKQAVDAELTAKECFEKADELSNEISAVGESIEQVKLANMHTVEHGAKLYAEKDLLKQSYKARTEESVKKMVALNEAIDPVLIQNLESRLGDTESQVDHQLKYMEITRTSDLDSLKSSTIELDDAKESLENVAEESMMHRVLEIFKIELEDVKKEHAELKSKEAETDSVAANLHVKLRKTKSELEAALAEESKIEGTFREMILALDQLVSKSKIARRDAKRLKEEAEMLKKEAEELKKKEAEANRTFLEATKEKLNNALLEAEEAKIDEARAIEQIKVLSERTNAARASTSDAGTHITISKDEYESLLGKLEEYEKSGERKAAAASENEALKKLQQEAQKKAEMAEAAVKAVEGELRRWPEPEQKKLAEAASRVLAENDASMTSSSHNHAVKVVAQSPKLERS